MGGGGGGGGGPEEVVFYRKQPKIVFLWTLTIGSFYAAHDNNYRLQK